MLGARLKFQPNPGDYYVAWVETIETLVVEKGSATPSRLGALKDAWRDAYETTPHGKPVELGDGT